MRTLRQMLAYASVCAAFDLVRLNRASGCRKPKGARKKAELLHTGIAFGVKVGDRAILSMKDKFSERKSLCCISALGDIYDFSRNL